MTAKRIISLRLPDALLEVIDAKRGRQTRTAYIQALIENDAGVLQNDANGTKQGPAANRVIRQVSQSSSLKNFMR